MIPYEELCIALAQWRSRQGLDPGYAGAGTGAGAAAGAATYARSRRPTPHDDADTGFVGRAPSEVGDEYVEEEDATSMVESESQDSPYHREDLGAPRIHDDIEEADSGMVMAALDDSVGENTGLTQVAPAPGEEDDDLAPPPIAAGTTNLTDFGVVPDEELAADDATVVAADDAAVVREDDTGEIDPDQIEEVAPWREPDDDK